MELPATKQEKIKLTEINQYLTCYLCKGYLIDATTISECLHSFCRSCIIKFLQDNSYCPVCELIINKAKPNLKLDKTLQDIVYKLVPELFLHEMLRRKTFYKDYPQIASRVSPEERGEDTERTIFNPQELISLSLEYICDDSTPGAIRIPGIATDPETLKNNGTTEESQDSQMKRYLLCPGMCRIEVLKKFVRNKYNVDTNQFFIDVLYKRVPLPDHYTLIDIAYIYSWQRNEIMKFFFRIIDKNKPKRTDSPVSCTPQFMPRHYRRNRTAGERLRRDNAKVQRKSSGKVGNGSSRHPSQQELRKETKNCDKNISDKVIVKSESEVVESARSNERTEEETIKAEHRSSDLSSSLKVKTEENDNNSYRDEALNVLAIKTDSETNVVSKTVDKELLIGKDAEEVPKISDNDERKENIHCQVDTKCAIENDVPLLIKKEPVSPEAQKTDNKLILKVSKEFLDKAQQQVFSTPVTKSYTSITLNRSENVEIITKIESVSNKDGQPIGHHIIKQTIKKGSKVKANSPKKASKIGPVTVPRLVITKKGVKKKASPKRDVKPVPKVAKSEPDNRTLKTEIGGVDDEKSEFLKYMNLTPKVHVKKEIEQIPIKKETCEVPQVKPPQLPKKQIIISRPPGGQKRKNSSPVKNEKVKVPRIQEAKKPVKIILQDKPSSHTKTSAASSDNGLQSLISNCKIPSSLSITIKEGSERDQSPLVVPPVKNYIEILKLPEESANLENNSKEATKLEISKFCDNDSEQKVDQDLAEIAKSLTEKIPMSTTVSQIVGPKQQFQIPVKTNIPPKVQIQPSPVPEVNKAKENLVKLTPRSPQTFQKIFEESLKKPPEGPKTSAVELPASDSSTPSSSKRNILEIASQLFKKTKQEQDKKEVLPKVPIPRLPNSRTQKLLGSPKLVPQTVASLHSTSLGMNYTVSVGQQSPSKVMKSNGIVSPVKAESVPDCKSSLSPLNELKTLKSEFKVPSPSLGSPKLSEIVVSANCSSPRPKTPSPKHSPKSSPLVKHMYAPTVPMFGQKTPTPLNRFASLSPKPPQNTSKHPTTSPRQSSPSPKPSTSTPKESAPTSTQNGNSAPSLSPNEILEKYNIQNLAQLTASFNLNPSVLASNQLAAFQHAMLLKHFEMQNRQNWLNRNQGPLLQYEKYLQSLNGGLNGSHSQT